MPIKVDTPSWFSALQANDKPVYLNEEGRIKTGKSLKGRLVSIAESLGIFKDYAGAYRKSEINRNRNAYHAVWNFVNQKYSCSVGARTKSLTQDKGYSSASIICFKRLQGHDPNDPKRAIVGRELRLILDTARAVDYGLRAEKANGSAENLRGLKMPPGGLSEVRSKPSQTHKGLDQAVLAGNSEQLHQIVGSETQIREFAQRDGYKQEVQEAFASRRGYVQEKMEEALNADPNAKDRRLTSNEFYNMTRDVFGKIMRTQFRHLPIAKRYGNANGSAENLRGLKIPPDGLSEAAETQDKKVVEASPSGYQVDEVRSKPPRIHKELGRAVLAVNSERLHQRLGSETQIRELAQELGHDQEAIASRRGYIQNKLEERLNADPRAKSRKLTSNEFRDMAHSVFDNAIGKNPVAASIRGAMRGTARKVKHALDEDNPGQVDVLKLSKDKIKVGARDRKYLQKLMVDRLDIQDQEISAIRMRYVERNAIEEATARVRETKVELSSAEVDDVLVLSLRKSREVGEAKAWLGGVLDKVNHTMNPPSYGYKRSAEDVLEKAADENRARVEAADEQAEVHDAQQQPEQASSPPVNEPVASPPQHHDSPEPVAVVASSASPQPMPLPKPRRYEGVDYFDQSDKGIRRLGILVRNHQCAKQVVADDTYLATSVPEGRRRSDLTPEHRGYIKTTLLRHVEEHGRTKPGVLLDAGDLHRMMRPITARALQMQSGSKLRAKVLYKNVTKHLGRKDVAFSDAMKKVRRDARTVAGSKATLPSFVEKAARDAGIDIKIDSRVFTAIRPQVKDMAEDYVKENRKAITEPEIKKLVQTALRGYRIANRMGWVS